MNKHILQGLQDANGPPSDVNLEDINSVEDIARYIRKPFVVGDSDNQGTEDAWHWVHFEKSMDRWIYQEDRGPLRK
ncbi:hypothetical protein Sste5346_008513 [Sporothrix stenoceras]|uniref:Uncharacterized protein n=1 Tax=Sporothrix stenoceras TaxID=5173 RepID=A0ABR3YNZ6_9PEZI